VFAPLFLTNRHLLFTLNARSTFFCFYNTLSLNTGHSLSLECYCAFPVHSEAFHNERGMRTKEQERETCQLAPFSHGRLVKANAVGLQRERGPA